VRRLAVLLAPVLLAGCTGVADLKETRRPLSGDEVTLVRKRADEALGEKRWQAAWDQEAEAGADRDRLEAVFLASLAADQGPYEDMLAQLRAKFGGLSDSAKTSVARLANEHEGKGEWKKAVDVLILTAEDAPAYRAAWDLYTRASLKAAPEVLHRIQDARKAWDAAHAAEGK
jgi:hypothetical protein